MKHTVFLLTGSNIGDSEGLLRQASNLLAERVGAVVKQSSFYRTEPWGNKDQQPFLNQVLQVETNLEPLTLLGTTLGIEKEMGRNRQEKWGPRTIDIDILFYDDETINEPQLVIPHPFLHERRFTLEPLNEIAPHLQHPVLHHDVAYLLKVCADEGVVEKL